MAEQKNKELTLSTGMGTKFEERVMHNLKVLFLVCAAYVGILLMMDDLHLVNIVIVIGLSLFAWKAISYNKTYIDKIQISNDKLFVRYYIYGRKVVEKSFNIQDLRFNFNGSAFEFFAYGYFVIILPDGKTIKQYEVHEWNYELSDKLIRFIYHNYRNKIIKNGIAPTYPFNEKSKV